MGDNEVLVGIQIPLPNPLYKYFIRSYKQARRRDDSKGIVSAGFRVELKQLNPNDDQWQIISAKVSLSGMTSKTFLAINTEQELIGLSWTRTTINQAFQLLLKEIPLDQSSPGGQFEYKRTLVQSFLFKFYSYVCKELRQPLIDSTDLSYHRGISHGQQTVPIRPPSQKIVGSSLSHRSAYLHATGEAIFIEDMPSLIDTLHASLVLSTEANARIKHIGKNIDT
jgi:hypothetical protein